MAQALSIRIAATDLKFAVFTLRTVTIAHLDEKSAVLITNQDQRAMLNKRYVKWSYALDDGRLPPRSIRR